MTAYLLSKTAYLLSNSPRIMRARDSSNNRKIEIIKKLDNTDKLTKDEIAKLEIELNNIIIELAKKK